MEDDDDTMPRPDSLLPYEMWAQEAMRGVAVRALQFAAAEGLPGEHHFYVSFRTDMPGVSIPSRLKAQYPEEMTIVLQHQFWDLVVDEATGFFSVGLSFGGVPSNLRVPLTAITAFADPHVRIGLQFTAAEAEAEEAEPDASRGAVSPAPPGGTASSAGVVALSPPAPSHAAPAEPGEAPAAPQVVSLDAFRRKPREP